MARRLITAVALAAALQVCNGFLAPTARCSSRSSLALQAKKGFGKAEPPKKEKSKGQQLRDDAADNYQEMKDAGVPEYNVFIREAGLGDDKWVPAGVMAVPRNEKVDTAILANEDKLLGSILRQFPGLKNAVGYEFGYNRKVRARTSRWSKRPCVVLTPGCLPLLFLPTSRSSRTTPSGWRARPLTISWATC
mmetsp:Transcript_26670/g.83436  ORF Transcript_26670/g.83436 Transcript_26670/m.83436 type:complete len:192 (+) Transcript_26670:179-754(+)